MKSSYHVVEEMRSLSNVIKASSVTLEQQPYALETFSFDFGEEKEEKVVVEEEIQENIVDEIAELRSNVEKEIEDLKQQAEHEIALQREQLLNEMEERRQQLFEETKAKALEEGITQAKKEMESNLAKIEDLKREAIEEREAMLKGAEPEIADLLFGLTKHIVGTHIRYNPEYIYYLIRSGLRLMKDKKNLIIRISEEDAHAKEYVEQYGAEVREQAAIEFIVQDDLEKGTCLIEAEDGNIDASLTCQFDKLREHIELLLYEK